MVSKKKVANLHSSSVLKMGHVLARKFFLKGSSYCSFDLPKYLTFDDVLQPVSNFL